MPSSYGANSYQTPPPRRNRRRDYEDLSQTDADDDHHGGRGGGAMQTMEILSGGEYGKEFDGSSSSSSGAMASRWIMYGFVAFLLLIIVIAPTHHPDDDDNSNSSSNFKLPKNSHNGNNNINNNNSNDNNDSMGETVEKTTTTPKTTSPPSNTASATSAPSNPSTNAAASASTEAPNPSTTTRPSTSTPTTSTPTTTTTTEAPISTEAQEGKWIETSPPDNETPVEFYDDICNVPKTYKKDQQNFTYLDVTNFCLPEKELVSEYGCRCKNPIKPIPNPDSPPERWNATFEMNIGLVNKAPSQLDVVFLGDSITEHWNGRDGGKFRDKDHNVSVVFDTMFHKQNGGKIEAIALGIAGDRCENLLYRIQNGEMPPALNPKVFWLLIGTNDLGVDNCSADTITVGNIRIIEEIRKHYPETLIIINSILPRGQEELLHASPIWKVIYTINQQLDCYADTHDNVQFFNATDLFLTSTTVGSTTKGEERFYVNQTLMNDFIHPTGEGSMIWGNAIIEELKFLHET